MTRAALYARVSLEKQTTEQQITALREAAERMRLGIASVIEETGSGAKADRPGLLALMEAARRREVSAVLVWKLDRLGRSLIDLVKNLDELRRLGVRVVAVTQGLDLDPEKDDAATRFVSHVLGAAAEYERALIVERTVAGLGRVKRERRDYSGPKGTWPVGRPPASPVMLHAAAELVAAGSSIRAAARVKGLREATLRRSMRSLGGS